MTDVKTLAPRVERQDILDFEREFSNLPGVKFGDSDLCPLTHRFAPGCYIREMFIRKGVVIISKIHKTAHHNILLKGRITVVSEFGGVQTLTAPAILLSKPGAKRIGYAHEDTIWATVHPTTDTDLAKIEEQVIAKSYEELELSQEEMAQLQTDDQQAQKLIEVINAEA